MKVKKAVMSVLTITLAGCATTIGKIPKAKAESGLAQTCIASWYGPGFHGRIMANGQRFNMNDRSTVAHKKLSFGTRVQITNLRNGRSIISKVSDRGPYARNRCVDVSKAGASALGFLPTGTAPVRVVIVGR